jgi:hypothetical protein
MDADYDQSTTGAVWNDKTKKWEIPANKLDCITAVNFFLGCMLQEGGKGYSPNVAKTNLVHAAALTKPFSNYFKDYAWQLLTKGGDPKTLQSLATGGASYAKVDDWFYSKMPWGLNTSMSCRCKLHLSPKDILDSVHQLTTVNIASVSLGSTTKDRGLDFYQTPSGEVDAREADFASQNRDKHGLHWEHSTMMLFKLSGKLYVYHHISTKGSRFRTFQAQCQVYIDQNPDKFQDSLWLVWSLPDSVINDKNKKFFYSGRKRWQPKI